MGSKLSEVIVISNLGHGTIDLSMRTGTDDFVSIPGLGQKGPRASGRFGDLISEC